jgi:hypothetical protein
VNHWLWASNGRGYPLHVSTVFEYLVMDPAKKKWNLEIKKYKEEINC